MKLQVLPCVNKAKSINIFKKFKNILNKSPLNKNNLIKNSKNQFPIMSEFEDFQARKDYYDKEKLFNKYKANKNLGGLSPIFDIEK